MKKIILVLLVSAGCVAMGVKKATYDPQIDPKKFSSTVNHPFYPLVPGTTYKITETKDGKSATNTIEVTNETKMIAGVKCVVVHDTLTQDGAMVEDTLDWFAQDDQGTVWYFGEATKEYKANGEVETKGSWEAGVDGAQAGIIMPAAIKPGEPYRQEYKFKEAEDMGQVIAVNTAVTVPASAYTDCLKTKEWSLLEPGHEFKWYCKGVGFVRSESADGEVAVLDSVTKK